MFARKKTEAASAVEESPVEPARSAGKGRPTPKRRDAEAANRRPLVSGDKRTDRTKAREEAAKQRRLMDAAMQTGDERYLPAQHKGPARRFARDYIDARWTLGEFFLPLAVLVMLILFGSAMGIPAVVVIIAMVTLYVFAAVAIIEAAIYGSIVRKRALATFGRNHVRGLRLYTAMRSLQLRRMRLPKPQVKRGEHPS